MSNSRELVINFHMTESCNFRCDYCYATWGDGCHTPELHRQPGAVEELIERLADYFFSDNDLRSDMHYESVRLNFAGGEPMLLGSRFYDALLFAKNLGFRTSIITNGSFLTDEFLNNYSQYLDVLGVSFDSDNKIKSKDIGRVDNKGDGLSLDKLIHIATLYRKNNPSGYFKMNTVVNKHNCHESFHRVIDSVRPDKWKVLRVLPVYDRIHTISDDEFCRYVGRHESYADVMVVEDNSDMTESYVMINPQGRFYQNNNNEKDGYHIGHPILQVGVEVAFKSIYFDARTFMSRYQSEPLAC